MIVLGNLLAPHGFRANAIQIFRGICSLMEVVMENDCFRDAFGIEWVVSMLWNQELKISKVVERAYYWMYRICDIWSIRCKVDHYIVV
jgi:hypothetical protein